MSNGIAKAIGVRRDRDERVSQINAAENTENVQSFSDAPSGRTDDQNGYWNGSTYVTFFRLGRSKLGGPDRLK